jgi:Fe-Mn family superoxide dismutase
MAFELPTLPYDHNALEPVIDEQTMQLHHEKHHATYIEKLNTALSEAEGDGNEEFQNLTIHQLLRRVEELPEDIKTAVRNNGGGHANHSLFWEVMRAPQKENLPEGTGAEAINSTFGNFEAFKEEFAKAGLGQFGSGWAWLTVENGELHVCSTPNQDNPWMKGNTPILGLDVWEHAYYLKYQNKRADYIEAWWQVVNWAKVEENFSLAPNS